MTTMNNHTVSTTDWTEVAAGAGNVAVSTRSVHHFLVHVGEAKPTNNPDAVGHVLGTNKAPVSFSALTATDNVYVRAQDQGVTVTVTAS
jgi:hypothetical protein